MIYKTYKQISQLKPEQKVYAFMWEPKTKKYPRINVEPILGRIVMADPPNNTTDLRFAAKPDMLHPDSAICTDIYDLYYADTYREAANEYNEIIRNYSHEVLNDLIPIRY